MLSGPGTVVEGGYGCEGSFTLLVLFWRWEILGVRRKDRSNLNEWQRVLDPGRAYGWGCKEGQLFEDDVLFWWLLFSQETTLRVSQLGLSIIFEEGVKWLSWWWGSDFTGRMWRDSPAGWGPTWDQRERWWAFPQPCSAAWEQMERRQEVGINQ